MSHFDPRIITSNPSLVVGPILVGIGLLLIIIIAWASLAYVPAGNVGVLVNFGRVTGETLSAGTHFVSPFKINHVFSVHTQSQEEHTSIPSREDLNLEIDTSLDLSPGPEPRSPSLQQIRTGIRPHNHLTPTCAPLSATPRPDIQPIPFIQAHANKWKMKSKRD